MRTPAPMDETATDGESVLDLENSNSLEEPLIPQSDHSRLQEETNDEISSPPRRSPATIQLYKLAAWMFVLTLAWLASKGWCYVGLPYDCQKGWETAGAMEDLQHLFLYGLALALMVGVLEDDRLSYLLCRQWYFLLLMFGSAPVFSFLSNCPYMDASISPPLGVKSLVLIGIVTVLGLGVLGWHFVFAFATLNNKEDVMVYVVSRLGVLAFYSWTVFMAVVPNSEYQYHLHHYFIAYSLALFCRFDHVFSVMMLAVATGIFVQGLAAYDFAELFSKKTSL